MEKTGDPFWIHVKDMDDGSGWKQCVFCEHLFAPATSISRVKWHLSGERGRGVSICKKVPPDIQGAAFQSTCGVSKRHKSIASSSSASNDAISTCPQEQNRGVENFGEDIGMVVQPQAQGLEQRVTEERTSSLEEVGSHMGNTTGMGAEEEDVQGNGGAPSHAQAAGNLVENLPRLSEEDFQEFMDGLLVSDMELIETCRDIGMVQSTEARFSCDRATAYALEPRGDAVQTTTLQPIANNAQLMEVDIETMKTNVSCLMEEEEVEQEAGALPQPATGSSSSGGPPCNTTHETRGDALPTSSLVGEASDQNKALIWSWLMNDEVSIIAVYGMGGIGKTTLVKHINNQLLEARNTFSDVFWITVSQDFSISRLQNLLAKCIGLDLSNEDGELSRAAKLFKELQKKHKWVLILDDLWNCFDLQKVGIPIQKKGCKLIVTTRSLRVCRGMRCGRKIEIKRLSREEAWSLFLEKLIVHDLELSPKILQIAMSIVEECAGLPLGIITMAGSMRGVDDLHEWRSTLKKLKESEVKDIEDEVFRILRFSYDHLNDLALQQCFLYCALFPEDYKIDRIELINYLIDEGIIKEMSSMQEEFDEGHTMLNTLESVCLLERCQGLFGALAVKMHDLIRDMALNIQQVNSQVIVKAGKQLKELPGEEEWKENLVRVSLMDHQINEIPSNHSPRCPNLSTLLLCNGIHMRSIPPLRFIADSFFEQFCGLKVLDLSFTSIQVVPNSISDLVTLRAILLRYCHRLRHVPSLKKLKALRRLDLICSSELKNMPQDMEWLLNLRYLRLSGCGQRKFPTGVLPKLSQLGVFIVERPEVLEPGAPRAWVKGKEVACLRKLETLECHFQHPSDLTDYLKYQDESQSLSTYSLFVGPVDKHNVFWWRKYSPSPRAKAVWMGSISISNSNDRDVQVMLPNDINQLRINKCNDATSLCDVSSSIKHATELEVIHIWECKSMESLLSSSLLRSAPHEPFSYPGVFSGLKEFCCSGCRSLKKLFPLVLLPKLEEIEVTFCPKLEEIIGGRDEDEESITEFNLPNLRVLELIGLPELKSLCSAKLRCNALQRIRIHNCPKLKKMPISLGLLDDGQPSPPPFLKEISIDSEEWWKSVEWNHPTAKDVLQPFVLWERVTVDKYMMRKLLKLQQRRVALRL